MAVYTIDPLGDPRWPEFVGRSSEASVFHSRAWVTALQRTYGYEPIVFTTSPPGNELGNGILLCKVRSWLTGRRLVSVPFADHCQPLVERQEDRAELLSALRDEVERGWRYIEFRPLTPEEWEAAGMSTTVSYRLHVLSLRGTPQEIFAGFHPSAVQRRVRRAEREAIRYEEGRSEPLLNAFYALLLQTRRRHGVPPQPREWFANLSAAFGDALKVRMALWRGRPAAAMLTLQHGDTLVYKYGGSDASLHHLGVVPFLFWNTIRLGVEAGLQVLDLGRSDLDNPGLMTFKERLGSVSSPLAYVRWPGALKAGGASRPMSIAGRWLARAPDCVFTAAGKLVYPHLG